MKKILILGSDGYVGSRLYEHLRNLQMDVSGVDLGWFGKLYKETIIVDYKYISKEELSKYSHVVLAAAHSSVSMCENNLSSTVKNNINNLIDLLDKLEDTQTLIYMSTAAIYENSDAPSTELSPVSPPRNPYDYSKITGEQVINLYPNKNVVCLRLGSVNGFSKNMRSENLINSLTATYFRGDDLIISNGDKMRAVLGITDLCRAVSTIISNDHIPNKIYNLVSVNDTILNFGKTIQLLTDSNLVVNDKYKTDFSFNCSSQRFQDDYNFKFLDTTESIFNELVTNKDNVIINLKRGRISYV